MFYYSWGGSLLSDEEFPGAVKLTGAAYTDYAGRAATGDRWMIAESMSRETAKVIALMFGGEPPVVVTDSPLESV